MGNKRGQALAAIACILLASSVVLAVPAQRNGPAYERAVLEIQRHIQNGDLEGAYAQLAQARKQYPLDGGLENLLGVVEIQKGHTDAAELAFSQAILHSPRLTSAYLNLGRLYMQNPDRDAPTRVKALQVYERALAIAPSNAEANYQAAVLLMLAGSYERSLNHIVKLDETVGTGPGVLAVECADQAGLGHREAADRAAATLAGDPRLAEADAMEVLPVLRSAQRADLAALILGAAGEHEPLSPTGLRALGLAQETAGTLKEARNTLEQAALADGASTSTLVALARVARAQKDTLGALGYLAHARDMEPANPILLYYFGLASLDMSLLGEARKAFGEAVRIEPGNPAYNFAMGTVSAFAQDPALALPYLQKYHALRPGDPAGVLALGTTYFRAKDFETAGTWLRMAEKSGKTAATAHYYLGRVARQQGRLEDAVSELNKAVAATGHDQPEVLAELGQVYTQMHNYPEAEKELDRAIRLDPNNYVANFALLQLYARTGDARRGQQAKHFDHIRNENQTQFQDMMRIIEIRPQENSAPQ